MWSVINLCATCMLQSTWCQYDLASDCFSSYCTRDVLWPHQLIWYLINLIFKFIIINQLIVKFINLHFSTWFNSYFSYFSRVLSMSRRRILKVSTEVRGWAWRPSSVIHSLWVGFPRSMCQTFETYRRATTFDDRSVFLFSFCAILILSYLWFLNLCIMYFIYIFIYLFSITAFHYIIRIVYLRDFILTPPNHVF